MKAYWQSSILTSFSHYSQTACVKAESAPIHAVYSTAHEVLYTDYASTAHLSSVHGRFESGALSDHAFGTDVCAVQSHSTSKLAYGEVRRAQETSSFRDCYTALLNLQDLIIMYYVFIYTIEEGLLQMLCNRQTRFVALHSAPLRLIRLVGTSLVCENTDCIAENSRGRPMRTNNQPQIVE